MGVVETVIWLVIALVASGLALGFFLLMAAVGAALLLAGRASRAVRSLFGGVPKGRVTYQRSSPEQYEFPKQGVRRTILEGEVLRRSE